MTTDTLETPAVSDGAPRAAVAPHPGARHRARRTTSPQSLRAAWPALLGLCLAMLVEMVDNSILNIALPTVGRELHASPTDLQWIVGAYSLTFGGLLMVGGTIGDKIGRRRTLLTGLALFGLAGLGVLLVRTPEQLIAVRALSGAFAALMAPITMSLIFRLFDDDVLRGRAIGLIMVVSMVGFALGPTLAGLAVAHMPWQALLVLNAPAALLAWLGVRFGVSPDRSEDLRRGVMFVSTQLYQFAWGWSAFRAGLANLPFVVGMLAVGPLVDGLVARIGQRRTSIIGLVCVLLALAIWIWALSHGYLWCAVGMLIMTAGMRIIMTTGAVALVGALPESHTSIGSALNDTAQELGNAVGVAIVGTVMAAVVGRSLPQGAWDAGLVDGFVHSQQISFTLLAGIVLVMGVIGVRTLTDSTETEER
ncbi:Antiseptic resistance protein [Rothia kristinae]|uniref:MFS transporter n=1 Tax=Rothia kristinae TaxID=37923 RepID=UPI000774CFAD|nr:MFS transporter [Rothia kristinae]SQC30165.1 Antiseptic resistance protein [Rothia kristinae]